MYYQIMNLRSFGGEYEIYLAKDGNKYVVGLQWYEEGDIMKTRLSQNEKYDSIDEAIKVFNIGAELVGKSEGTYSYKSMKMFGC